MKGIRKFEKYNKLSRRIQERNKRRRNMMDREEKRKTEGGRGRVESRGRRV